METHAGSVATARVVILLKAMQCMRSVSPDERACYGQVTFRSAVRQEADATGRFCAMDMRITAIQYVEMRTC